MKDLIKQIEATKDIRAIAKEKSSIAKMNMVIPNADLRECLKELSVFQKNLQYLSRIRQDCAAEFLLLSRILDKRIIHQKTKEIGG